MGHTWPRRGGLETGWGPHTTPALSLWAVYSWQAPAASCEWTGGLQRLQGQWQMMCPLPTLCQLAGARVPDASRESTSPRLFCCRDRSGTASQEMGWPDSQVGLGPVGSQCPRPSADPVPLQPSHAQSQRWPHCPPLRPRAGPVQAPNGHAVAGAVPHQSSSSCPVLLKPTLLCGPAGCVVAGWR